MNAVSDLYENAWDVKDLSPTLRAIVSLRFPSVDRKAQEIHAEKFCNHRGVIQEGEWLLIFGNDGWGAADGRVRREVELTVNKLHENGWLVMGFGLAEEDYTWVLLVSADSKEPAAATQAQTMVDSAWWQATDESRGR
jgi:hypothetical protein